MEQSRVDTAETAGCMMKKYQNKGHFVSINRLMVSMNLEELEGSWVHSE